MENYKLISEKLKILFKLDKSPVAVKLFKSTKEAEKILPKYESKARHCEMVYKTATEKISAYTTINEAVCLKGAAALGLIDKELDVLKVEPIMKAVGYMPLENAKFEVDAIILYVTPREALNIVQFYRNTTGKSFDAHFSGAQSLCSDAVSRVFLNHEPNLTLGCNGSRQYTNIKDEELIISLTLENAIKITSFI